MSALLLITLCALFIYKLFSRRTVAWKKVSKYGDGTVLNLKQAPGPIALPVIGSMHLLGKFESPFQSFTELSKTHGDIYSIKLGSSECLVVNSLELIREVLNQNGKFFGGRPDFLRFHKLFAGDRNNSLALCDWSNLQLRRRNLARRHCGPKQHTDNFAKIGSVATFEAVELVQTLRNITRTTTDSIDIKPLLMSTAMNMFSNYMCNVRFDTENDQEFRKIVDHFDEIFWEINQGYAVDFLPWLAPFYKKHMDKLYNWSQEIRAFILSRIVEQREINLDMEGPEKDFLDGLLRVLHDDPTVDRNTIIFMLEDFLGGHSSVGNLVMLCLTAVARDPEVGKKVRAEIDAVTKGKRAVTLTDRMSMPYTEATILECLRYASSPIVPHVATENANVAGYGVEKGTTVFINNYELNTSPKYWNQPEKFDPSRFLERTKVRARRNSQCDSGMESDSERSGPINRVTDFEKEIVSVKKNIPHFLPFSIGKRTCIGQTLVTTMSFVMFANIIQEFDVGAVDVEDLRQKPACVALPKDTYNLYLLPRKH
ncbi:cytochrome P450 307a1-like [Maniola hyperantus]|uniref:cytochrome P450 307a1-like n=1 Tax=Aphantopus hyperantus TaxID=2795564 RepID=UPI001569E966|nr:cytochrome P450 307a1-like [Maniola hyperantus]